MGSEFERDRKQLAMSTSRMHTTQTSFGKLEKMGCYLKETKNNKSYLLAAYTQKDQSLESLKNGL